MSAAYFPPALVEEVRRVADIAVAMAPYVRLERDGRSLVGLCPFHSENTPSFYVSETKQLYHCFGCGTGGDVFRFVETVEDVSFPAAVRMLADRFGVPLSARPVDNGERNEVRQMRTESALLRALDERLDAEAAAAAGQAYRAERSAARYGLLYGAVVQRDDNETKLTRAIAYQLGLAYDAAVYTDYRFQTLDAAAGKGVPRSQKAAIFKQTRGKEATDG